MQQSTTTNFEKQAKVKQFIKHNSKFIIQVGVVCAVYYGGVLLSKVLPVAIPGNILGMMLLLVLLVSGIIKEHYIDIACKFFLKYMAVFFLPAAVAVMQSVGLLQNAFWQFALVCLITTLLVFIATSATVILVSRLTNKSVRVCGDDC